MPLETSTSPQAEPRTNLESTQGSKDSLSSPVDDNKDLEAQREGERVQKLAEDLTRIGEEEKPAEQQQQQPEKDPDLVEFDGPDDPGNPQ